MTGQSEWQLMETAPKGVPVLAWTALHGGSVVIARWNDNRYAKNPKPYWSFSDERTSGTTAVRLHQPTHWMSLPSAPTA